jgi:hypothetical protein
MSHAPPSPPAAPPPPSSSSPGHGLTHPEQPALALASFRAARPGQLVERADGQRLLVLSVRGDLAADEPSALVGVRVSWPREGVLPLGETVRLTRAEAEAAAPWSLCGAWYAEAATPAAERVVLEAIHRGLITVHTCGIPWPMNALMQLSDQAVLQIERYLFEVARTTGCAFPFHDIAQAMRGMHLAPRPDNPALCDILNPQDLSRHRARPDDDLLSLWARELRRRIHGSDWA